MGNLDFSLRFSCSVRRTARWGMWSSCTASLRKLRSRAGAVHIFILRVTLGFGQMPNVQAYPRAGMDGGMSYGTVWERTLSENDTLPMRTGNTHCITWIFAQD